MSRYGRKLSEPQPYSQENLAISSQTIPRSYKIATSPGNITFWKEGIDREHECLKRNQTWTLTNRENSMHVLPSKYVFKTKNNRSKARLVLLGCNPLYGVDYNETFSPVFSAIRTLLSMVSHCEQMDVVTSFLNGDLNEEIYMEIPEGLKTPDNSGKVCKHNKAIYGFKQAPRQWYSKIDD